MAAHCVFAGKSYKLERYAIMICMSTDTFREIPLTRWDMDMYYTSDSGQFATMGKSVQKHAGLVEERDLMNFDNRFFGIDAGTAASIAPSQRVIIETTYELLALTGWNKKSLRGSHLMAAVADIGNDWDAFYNCDEAPDAWLNSGCTGHSISTANRVCYTLGLMGPVIQVDTACSAALVSANMLHSWICREGDVDKARGFSMGHLNILTPWPFVGMSAAGMIGRAGRSMTFNESANGYARGEGSGGIYCQKSREVQVTQDRLACYCGSYVNQDGRSASLTAPNGPSQQMCIKGSLRSGGLSAEQLMGTENHGTGTALGDPIETGSIARIFQKFQTALPVMSVKTMTGHLEGCAGSSSLLKVLSMLLYSIVPGNVHLRNLNAHMVEEGFPGIYPNDLGDQSNDSGIIGLNAFGFGGTNSRAELWARGRRMLNPTEIVKRGLNGLRADKLGPSALRPRELGQLDCVTVACPRCLGPTCWLCGEALSTERTGKHHCAAIREDFATYEHCSRCYTGAYRYGSAISDSAVLGASVGHRRKVYLVGTFSAWSTFTEMEEVTGGVYRGRFVLGETRVERFQLVLNQDRSKTLFPLAAKAGPETRIAGPSSGGRDKAWQVDGRREGKPAGTVYEVTFEWADLHKTVRWSATADKPTPEDGGAGYEHVYSICRAGSGWRLEDMRPSPEDPSAWEWEARGAGAEELHFVRDKDNSQTIYPLEVSADSSVPVMGPDEGGVNRGWRIRGNKGEVVSAKLSIRDGDIAVTVSAKLGADGEPDPMRHRTWRSAPGSARNHYFISGSWADWRPARMEPDSEGSDAHRWIFRIGDRGKEEFHILVNRNANMSLYPANQQATPGEALMCGPGDNLEGFCWEVSGPEGQVTEVWLDFGAEDWCSALTCRPVQLQLEEE